MAITFTTTHYRLRYRPCSMVRKNKRREAEKPRAEEGDRGFLYLCAATFAFLHFSAELIFFQQTV